MFWKDLSIEDRTALILAENEYAPCDSCCSRHRELFVPHRSTSKGYFAAATMGTRFALAIDGR